MIRVYLYALTRWVSVLGVVTWVFIVLEAVYIYATTDYIRLPDIVGMATIYLLGYWLYPKVYFYHRSEYRRQQRELASLAVARKSEEVARALWPVAIIVNEIAEAIRWAGEGFGDIVLYVSDDGWEARIFRPYCLGFTQQYALVVVEEETRYQRVHALRHGVRFCGGRWLGSREWAHVGRGDWLGIEPGIDIFVVSNSPPLRLKIVIANRYRRLKSHRNGE